MNFVWEECEQYGSSWYMREISNYRQDIFFPLTKNNYDYRNGACLCICIDCSNNVMVRKILYRAPDQHCTDVCSKGFNSMGKIGLFDNNCIVTPMDIFFFPSQSSSEIQIILKNCHIYEENTIDTLYDTLDKILQEYDRVCLNFKNAEYLYVENKFEEVSNRNTRDGFIIDVVRNEQPRPEKSLVFTKNSNSKEWSDKTMFWDVENKLIKINNTHCLLYKTKKDEIEVRLCDRWYLFKCGYVQYSMKLNVDGHDEYIQHLIFLNRRGSLDKKIVMRDSHRQKILKSRYYDLEYIIGNSSSTDLKIKMDTCDRDTSNLNEELDKFLTRLANMLKKTLLAHDEYEEYQYSFSEKASDEIKQNSIPCTSSISDIITSYTTSGWTVLADSFITNKAKEAKNRDFQVTNIVDESSLIMFGKLREFVVQRHFKCAMSNLFNNNKYKNNNNNIYFTPVGNNSITSDYDVILIGKKSYEVMITMIYQFEKQNSHMLTDVFDTNIYCIGIYEKPETEIYDPLFFHIDTEKDHGYFLAQKTSETQQETLRIYAGISLVEAFTDFGKYGDKKPSWKKVLFDDDDKELSNMEKLIGSSQEVYLKIKEERKKMFENIKGNRSSDAKNILVDYNLYFKNVSKLSKQLYPKTETQDDCNNSASTDDVIKMICKSMFYSIESYYTPSTFAIVVLHMQQKKNILHLITANDYLCCIMENIAYLYKNIKNIYYKDTDATDETKAKFPFIFMKNSKYLHRTVYAFKNLLEMGRVSHDTVFKDYKVFLEQLEKYINPNRSEKNVERLRDILKKVNFHIGTTDLWDYIKKHISTILKASFYY